jgi:hypothetical protein
MLIAKLRSLPNTVTVSYGVQVPDIFLTLKANRRALNRRKYFLHFYRRFQAKNPVFKNFS